MNQEYRLLRVWLAHRDNCNDIGASSALVAAQLDNLRDLVPGHQDRAVMYLRRALRRHAADVKPLSRPVESQMRILLKRLENLK